VDGRVRPQRLGRREGGTVGVTLRTRRQKNQTPPLKDGASGEAIAYLRVEKLRFLFLEGSTGAVAAADTATVAPPDTPAACADTSVARAASSVDRLAAGAC
jgi:hypothetical protein